MGPHTNPDADHARLLPAWPATRASGRVAGAGRELARQGALHDRSASAASLSSEDEAGTDIAEAWQAQLALAEAAET
jgi:hypothetical protein